MRNLYIVSTPIGSLQDITMRAAKTLVSVPYVIAESASKADILLSFIAKELVKDVNSSNFPRIISYSEDEEVNKLPYILKLLLDNDVALISEAGTPLISDPGFKLVRESIKRGINIISIPGPTSVISALTSSGMPSDKFIFLGYFPKKEGKQKELLNNLLEIKQKIGVTAIFFESPHRLLSSLRTIQLVFGDSHIVVAREMTKVHEEVLRQKVSLHIKHFESKKPKGEIVVVI